MEEPAKDLMRKLLSEGKRNDGVRLPLISEGFNTEGFAETYRQLQEELGIEDPVPEKIKSIPTPSPVESEQIQEGQQVYSETIERAHRSSASSNTFKVLIGFLVVVVAVLMLSGIGPRMWQNVFENFDVARNTQNPADLARESQLRTLQIAAEAYHSKLLDYGGVCKSIGVNPEKQNCVENTETYAIDEQLSGGSYFCVDSSGFAGMTSTSHGGSGVCTGQ